MCLAKAPEVVTHGLATFQLKPPGFTANALFAHMVAFRARHSVQERPSIFLKVEMAEKSSLVRTPHRYSGIARIDIGPCLVCCVLQKSLASGARKSEEDTFAL